jgi:hypothetical protein
MKNITRWAAASAVIAILGACTTEATTDNGDGGPASGTAGSGGTSSTMTGGGSGGSGGSGTGGSMGEDGGSCMAPSNPTACETCVYTKCLSEICACNAITACKDAVGEYLTCLSGLDGGNMDPCASALVTAAGNSGSGAANVLTGCVSDNNCEDACQGRDAGPKPRP